MTPETKAIIMKALKFYDSHHGGIRGTDGFATARARTEVQALPEPKPERESPKTETFDKERERELCGMATSMLDGIESDEGSMQALEEAMSFFCDPFDICEGYKHAIRQCLYDDCENHCGENAIEDYEQLIDILMDGKGNE